MKVAILGTANASRAVAPFDDQDWRIWGCSQGNMNALPRIDVWFELHPISFFTSPENRGWGAPYIRWMSQQAFPIYLQEHCADIPQARVFPIGSLVKKFGRNWFTSSISMMMAYAITQMREGDEIALFGVDMAATSEHYTAQRAGIYRMTEIANEKGVSVITPYESDLGASVPIYGYCEATRFGRKMISRIEETKGLIGQMSAQRDKLNLEIAYSQGALHNAEWVARSFLDGEGSVPDFAIEPVPATPALDQPRPVTTGDFEAGPKGLFVPKHLNGGHYADLPEKT